VDGRSAWRLVALLLAVAVISFAAGYYAVGRFVG